MKAYKSVYVMAGKRKDGTYGVYRHGNIVLIYDSKESAGRSDVHIHKNGDIVVDIGLVFDNSLISSNGTHLNIDSRMNEIDESQLQAEEQLPISQPLSLETKLKPENPESKKYNKLEMD